MWFYRRMLKIPWTGHVTNGEILKNIRTKRKLLPTIRKRQLEFFWACYEKRKFGEFNAHGTHERKNSRGRPRIKYLTSLSTWMAEHVPEGQRWRTKEQDLLRRTKESKQWKTMIVHVLDMAHKGREREI